MTKNLANLILCLWPQSIVRTRAMWEQGKQKLPPACSPNLQFAETFWIKTLPGFLIHRSISVALWFMDYINSCSTQLEQTQKTFKGSKILQQNVIFKKIVLSSAVAIWFTWEPKTKSTENSLKRTKLSMDFFLLKRNFSQICQIIKMINGCYSTGKVAFSLQN